MEKPESVFTTKEACRMDIHNTSSTGSINIANAFDFEEFSKTEIGAAIAHLLEARCSTTESQAKLEAEQHLSYAVRFATQEKATILRIQFRRATKKSSAGKCWAGVEVSPNKAVARFRKLVKVVLS